MTEPEIVYDRATDTLMIGVSDEPGVEAYEPVPGVIVTVDADGDVTTLEFMGKVRERFAPLIDHFLAVELRQARRAG